MSFACAVSVSFTCLRKASNVCACRDPGGGARISGSEDCGKRCDKMVRNREEERERERDAEEERKGKGRVRFYPPE